MKHYSTLLRYFLFSVAVLGFLLLLRSISHRHNFLLEAGVIELTQEGLLVLVITGFSLYAYYFPGWRDLMVIFALLTSMLLIRELDAYLDDLILLWGWKTPFSALGLCIITIVIKNGDDVLRQFDQFLPSRASVILWCGVIILVLFAQLIGNGPMIEPIFGESYNRTIKRYYEELTELIGYIFFFAGMGETWFELTTIQYDN